MFVCLQVFWKLSSHCTTTSILQRRKLRPTPPSIPLSLVPERCRSSRGFLLQYFPLELLPLCWSRFPSTEPGLASCEAATACAWPTSHVLTSGLPRSPLKSHKASYCSSLSTAAACCQYNQMKALYLQLVKCFSSLNSFSGVLRLQFLWDATCMWLAFSRGSVCAAGSRESGPWTVGFTDSTCLHPAPAPAQSKHSHAVLHHSSLPAENHNRAKL